MPTTVPDTSIVPLPATSSPPCCATTSTGGSPGAVPEPDNTVLAGWLPSCEGGGVVPSATDIVDSESWDPAVSVTPAAASYTGIEATATRLTEVASVVMTQVGAEEIAAADAAMRVAVSEFAVVAMTTVGADDIPAADAHRVAAAEVAVLDTFGAVEEQTAVAVAEVAEVEMSGVIPLAAADALVVALSESPDVAVSGADETTRVAVTEVAVVDARVAAADTVPVAVAEVASVETSGVTAVTAAESTAVILSEVAAPVVPVTAADSILIRVSENEMALLNLQGGLMLPTPPTFTAAVPSFVNSTLNDGVDRVAVVFRAPKAGTLHSFEWRQGTNATSPGNGVRYAFQDLDASGDPDGTDDQFRTITTGFGAATWLVPPGPITSDGTDSGTKRTVTAGELLAAVIYLPNFTTGSVTFSQLDLGGAVLGISGQTYCDIKAAAFAKNFNTACMVLKYDDGTYATPSPDSHPILNLNTTTFNSGSTPDERGLIFSLPMRSYVSGIWVRLDLDNACDVVLYDSDGTTVLATTSLVSTARPSTAAQTSLVPFGPVLLLANTTYRVVIKPTTGSSVSTYDFDVTSAAVMAGAPGGANFYYTSRTDAGAWADVTTKRPWMGLLITGMSS